MGRAALSLARAACAPLEKYRRGLQVLVVPPPPKKKEGTKSGQRKKHTQKKWKISAERTVPLPPLLLSVKKMRSFFLCEYMKCVRWGQQLRRRRRKATRSSGFYTEEAGEMGIPMNYYDVVFTIVSSSAVRASSPEKKKSPMGPFYYFAVVLFESLPPLPTCVPSIFPLLTCV